MKKKITKIFVFMMAMAMLFSTAAACSQDDPNTIIVTRWASGTEKKDFEEWTKEFTEQTGINVVWKTMPFGAYFDKQKTDLLSRKVTADLIFLSTWAWKQYEKATYFEDLSKVEMLQDSIDGLLDDAKDKFMNGDVRLALPLAMNTVRPVLNLNFVEEAGVDITEMTSKTEALTSIEFTAFLKSVADPIRENDTNQAQPFMGAIIDPVTMMYILLASVDSPLVDYKTNKVMCNTKAGIAAMDELKAMYQSGYLVKFEDEQNGPYGTYNDAILGGRVASSFSGVYRYKYFESQKVDGKDLKVQALPPIKAVGGKDVMHVEFSALCVPKKSVKKDKVYQLLKFMLSKEAQVKLTEFSDLPINAEALDIVTSTWDAAKYASFNIGKENLHYPANLSTEFVSVFSLALSDFLNAKPIGPKTLTAADFCQTIKDAEHLL